jgi:hypothetical protein
MIKKRAIAWVAILGCSRIFAAHGDTTPLPTTSQDDTTISTPASKGSWSFGVQANYFKPNTDFNYALQDTSVPGSSKSLKTDTHYDWGWGADIRYHFPNSSSDILFSFTKLNSSENAAVFAPNAIMGTGVYASLNPLTYDSANTRVLTDYNAFTVDFGQKIAVNDYFSLHPFIGAYYSRINYKTTTQYSTSNTVIDSEILRSDFQGLGPRLGSDATIDLNPHFSLQGTVGGSLLIGNLTPRTVYTVAGQPTIDSNKDMNANTQLVPEIDAKLSALYKIDFNPSYAVGLEAGYQITNYFNAIQDDAASAANNTTKYSDFATQGPFVRAELDIA